MSSLTLLDVVGYGLGFLGSVAWIPQIYKIVTTKKGDGLPLQMFLVIDVITTLISVFCLRSGFPYSMYLEVLLTNCQIFLIQVLARYYLEDYSKLFGLIVFKTLYVGALGLLPFNYVQMSMSCLLPVMIINRSKEVYANYKAKSIGKLNPTSLAIQEIQFTGRFITALLSGEAEGFLLPMGLNVFFQTLVSIQYFMYGGAKDDQKKE